jgi:hypothetical protein
MFREPGSPSALSRLFHRRNPTPLNQSHSVSDTTSNRPSISHPFALTPNFSLSPKKNATPTPFTFTPPPSVATPIPVPLYRPASAPDFLERLSTFKLSTYRDKPTAIDAVAASRCGWRNEGGKDRLACNVCGAAWIVGTTTGMTREAGETGSGMKSVSFLTCLIPASALVARHVASLVQGHKTSCPWRLRQCDCR